MKRSLSAITALLLLCSSSLWSQPVGEVPTVISHYGAWDSSAGPALGLSKVMADTALHNKGLMVEGEILDVCRKKGCWLVVGDGVSRMRVTFKDYGFFVPTDSDGRTVRIQGIVSVEEIPEDLAKHYAEESKSEDPEEITGAQKVITMTATGVEIVR